MTQSPASHQQDLQNYHQQHMADGQDCYFDLQNGQLAARPEQQNWLQAHQEKTNRLLNIQPEDFFVDMGCGEGFLTLPLAARAKHSVGVDFVASPLAVLQQQMAFDPNRLLLAIAAGDALPIPDASADKVLCNHVLEHVLDDDAVVKEFYRIMRSGGLLVVGVPLALSPQVRFLMRIRRLLRPSARQLQLERVQPGQLVPELIGVQSHIRFYSLAALRDLLERNGFAVETAEGIGFSMRGRISKIVRRHRWLFGLATAVARIFPGMGDGVLILGRKV